MRRLATLGLAACALMALAPAVDAKVVRGGKVFVGEGAAGISLGMTKQQVKEQLGKPREQNPAFMGYGPKNSAEVSFDVYLEGLAGKPVRMIGLWGPRFKLPDGTSLFRAKDRPIPHLKKLYGKRLKKIHQKRVDQRLYRLKGEYRGRKTWTDFNVDKFGKDARVLSVFILYPNWTP
jgi:hypothetical protein